MTPWILIPLVATFLGLASRDDLTKFWWDKPHAGCHFLYRERMAGGFGFAWPLARTTQVLCWQNSQLEN